VGLGVNDGLVSESLPLENPVEADPASPSSDNPSASSETSSPEAALADLTASGLSPFFKCSCSSVTVLLL